MNTNKKNNHLPNRKLTKTPIKDAFLLSTQIFDSTYGGFGTAPKFPSPHKLMFLSRFGVNEDMINPLEMVEKTLNSIFKGGLYDHIGYGFFKYSTDDAWLIPNFEKTLYDNAFLLISYLETYEQTKKTLYKTICINTFEYIFTELKNDKGVFYSSEHNYEDFYIFKYSEIIDLLGFDDGNYFNTYYGITPEGNFEGSNIINLIDNYSYNQDDEKINSLRHKVFEYRNLRSKTQKDYTILTSSNAIMIAALAKAYKILNDETYLTAARCALNFIFENLTNTNGKLLSKIEEKNYENLGCLDDYCYVIFALIELYNATLDFKYLDKALLINKDMIDLFWDTENHGFFKCYNQTKSKDTINTTKDIYDEPWPSSNSVAAYNLVRLYKLTNNEDLKSYALNQLSAFYDIVKKIPIDHSFYIIALMEILYASNN